jgi:hypothetical protein
MLDWTRCSGQLSRAQETRTTSGSMQASTNHLPLAPWPVHQSSFGWSSHPPPLRPSFCPPSVLFFPFACPSAPTSFILCPSPSVLLPLRLSFSTPPSVLLPLRLSFCPSACLFLPLLLSFCPAACPSARPPILLLFRLFFSAPPSVLSAPPSVLLHAPQSVILLLVCLPFPPFILQKLQ